MRGRRTASASPTRCATASRRATRGGSVAIMTTFGFQIPNFRHAGGPTPTMFDDVVARCAAAEASGFDSVWVMDHFWQLPALGGPDEPILEAYTLLGALAARTERVQLGTLVTGVTYRNPALLAKIVTTLDVISKGRAILGIGAAWYEEEHDGLGFDFPPCRRAHGPARRGRADLPRDVPRRAPVVRRVATTASTRRATCRARSSRAARRS